MRKLRDITRYQRDQFLGCIYSGYIMRVVLVCVYVIGCMGCNETSEEPNTRSDKEMTDASILLDQADSDEVCLPSQTLCEASCTDLLTSNTHCGACHIICEEGRECVNGSCLAICEESSSLCDGRCVSLRTDEAHCGGCDIACSAGQQCIHGV